MNEEGMGERGRGGGGKVKVQMMEVMVIRRHNQDIIIDTKGFKFQDCRSSSQKDGDARFKCNLDFFNIRNRKPILEDRRRKEMLHRSGQWNTYQVTVERKVGITGVEGLLNESRRGIQEMRIFERRWGLYNMYDKLCCRVYEKSLINSNLILSDDKGLNFHFLLIIQKLHAV